MLRDTLDRPLHDVRISVTDRCNFRCPYCMPAEVYGESYRFLPRADILTFEEIARLARLFVLLGAAKIRLTGGEPLLRQNLDRLVALLAEIEGLQDLTLTTNGYLLAAQATALRAAGLRRITVSLDSLDPQVFGQMNGRGYTTERVLAGIAAARAAGLWPIKVNCVVQRGVNEHTVVDLAAFCRQEGLTVRFIEYMDVGNLNGWRMDDVVPAADILERLDAVYPLEPIGPAYRGEVATRYRYRDGAGEIGIISSVSHPFCGDCTRARLSTDGHLLTCLFATEGVDLRGPLRAGASDDDLLGVIAQTWRDRSDRYSEVRSLLASGQRAGRKKVEMYQIGG